MPKFLWIAALAAALFGTAGVAAQDYPAVEPKPLSGTWYVGPSITAEEGAAADHFFLTLDGDAAKAMWDAMPAKAESEECTGRMAKWAQSLVCYGPGTEMSGPLGPGESPFECYVGIDLKAGTIASPGDC